MKICQTELQALELTELRNLDPITVMWRDTAACKGKITIECAGNAWTATWGAIGRNKVCEFFAACDVNYLVSRLQHTGVKRDSGAEQHLARVIVAVQEALQVLKSLQDEEPEQADEELEQEAAEAERLKDERNGVYPGVADIAN